MGRPERALDASMGPIAAFAAELRELRYSTGNISYRQLARRAKFSPSVLSAAARGLSLPTLPVTLAFVTACGGDAAEWEARWNDLARRHGSQPAEIASVPAQAGVINDLPRPAQLPVGPRHMAGRTQDLARLSSAASGVPVLISGPLGVGKSALAVGWSKRNRERFPDGVLYADFSDPSATPAGILTDFLRGLGVLHAHVPATLSQCAALYRSLLRERRVLVVLDGLVSEDQVRSLLADAPGSQVLITSRSRLPGLDCVERVAVSPLPPEQSVEVLTAIVGAAEIQTDVSTAREIAALCDHLPLALAAVAMRVAVRDGWTLSRLAEQLNDPARRLDQLSTGGLDLRERLRSACMASPEPARNAFGRIARPSRQEILAQQVGEVVGVGAGDAEELLETLVDTGLMMPTERAGVYKTPALFRLYAAEMWQ